MTSMTMVIASVGIDVAKAKLDVVFRLGERMTHRIFPNDASGFEQLVTWLRAQAVGPVAICLEATGSYSDAIAQFLYEQGYTLSVLNPAVLVDYRKSKNRRSKTDKADAQLLAQYAQDEHPRAWKPLPKEIVTLRSLLAYRQDVQHLLQQERNRLEANRLDEWIRPRVQQRVVQLRAELKVVEQRMWAHLKAHEPMKSIWRRLQTIGGIGPVSAAALIAHIGEIERFGQANALVSLAGLAVKEYRSGSSVRGKAQIDRHGRALLRHLLYMCAQVAVRWDAHMRAWAARLRARGKPYKVVLVAVMRKLLHIVYGVWKSEQDYDPHTAFPLLTALETRSPQAV